ncbi:unnamed protein product [Ectocarpus sp. 12 AP-2014]
MLCFVYAGCHALWPNEWCCTKAERSRGPIFEGHRGHENVQVFARSGQTWMLKYYIVTATTARWQGAKQRELEEENNTFASFESLRLAVHHYVFDATGFMRCNISQSPITQNTWEVQLAGGCGSRHTWLGVQKQSSQNSRP